MNGELIRFAYLRTCTLGVIRFRDLELATIERPWIPNPAGPGGMLRESCIPDGPYHVQPWNSPRFPNTYILQNNVLGVYMQPNLIPPGQAFGRSAILIHVGNYVQDVLGCIAVGMHHAQDRLAVIDSRIAMDRLREVLGKEDHSLLIRPASTAEGVPST